MLTEPLLEENLVFEDINRGDKREFNFQITDSNRMTLFKIISQGTSSFTKDFFEWSSGCASDNLLTTLLLSTFVGMCIPGKHATFIDFHINFKNQVQFKKKMRLTGIISFKSQSTATIVEKISICGTDTETHVYADGKITAKVNKPTL